MDELYVALEQASASRIAILLFAFVLFYFLPSIIASLFRRKDLARFIALNLATGWTFAAWFALLIWAFTGRDKRASKNDLVKPDTTEGK
jgi:uncharacterized membrane protein